jgi:hypothetical protein
MLYIFATPPYRERNSMKITRCLAAACLAALAVPASYALSSEPSFPVPTSAAVLPEVPGAVSSSNPTSSSSSGGSTPVYGPVLTTAAAGANMAGQNTMRPFSALGVALKFGVEGIGLELATPLGQKVNLRASGSFFKYSPNTTVSNIDINGTIDFRTINASLDFYPWANAFRISPGLTIYNGNALHAIATVPAGQTFTLNDQDYTSSQTDPVTGTFGMAFGNKVAPSLTIGFGNMLPRRTSKHWSVPFEIGAEYIGKPAITLNLSGTACQNGINCQKVATDPMTQANIVAEQQKLNDDVAPLQFYPIVSIGVSYKFNFGSKE